MTPIYELIRGTSPLIISMPHSGLELPAELAERMTPVAKSLKDTDWHIPQLYDFVKELGATVIKANYSRYVVDLNRPASGESLYPGQATTGTCPVITFEDEPLYLAGKEFTDTELPQRIAAYWQPYHYALAAEIERVKTEHGFCLLYDAHSIRSHVPRLFEGELPTLNLGTARGESCDSELSEKLESVLAGQSQFQWVANGRFVGGYITRHYGQPDNGVHAVQMELAQSAYMAEDDSNAYLPEKAAVLQALLRQLLQTMLQWRSGH
ncbi:N-formylglutamate deformylase [Porticoccus sp. W117]|uniref:N-formylglutamate deformylase n=1 Tax=Porticoccus sp. W117 TaxID=3054777 RepID=UPI00259298F6|nr:N-formylglutamate deformylase [Porticoccus sp. W117]MDM3872429.1 N-formylglutamate deformylase [Porticoccus sp. W117]